jgi:hypothetical protein
VSDPPADSLGAPGIRGTGVYNRDSSPAGDPKAALDEGLKCATVIRSRRALG